MKTKITFLFAVLFMMASCSTKQADNSKKQYWKASTETVEGEYEGKFPCVDCESELVKLKLNMDLSAFKTVSYVNSDKAAISKFGEWSLDEDNQVVTITFNKSQSEFYKATVNQLTLMDSATKQKEQKSANQYTLTKE